MEQFSLEKYLENPSRKITTRYGDREVRIICTDRKDKRPIVALMIDLDDGSEYITSHSINGWIDDEEKYPDKRDLFFAEEEEKEELDEFEKELQAIISEASHWTSDDGSISTYCQFGDKEIKKISGQILDLAIQEIRKEQQEKLGTLEMPIDVTETYYIKGREDALKDLPKLEKTKDCIDPTIPIMYTNTPSIKSYVEYNGYRLCINDVFEKLPKEE